MTDVISIEHFKKEKEKQRWNEILLDLEQKIEEKEQSGPHTQAEEIGMKNFKSFIKKLRQKHCGED